MTFGGLEAISRPTRTSARTVVTLCALVLFASYARVPYQDFVVLGVRFSALQVESLATLLIALSTGSHLVNWIGDRISLTRWNIELRQRRAESNFGGHNALKPTLSFTLSDVRDLERRMEGDDRDLATRAIAAEEALRPSVLAHDMFARFLVYGWFLALPLSLVAWSVWVLHG